MSIQFAEGGSTRPSASELASFASKAREIDIGGDDIVELGDDLGLNLMANPNKIAPSPRSQRQVSFGTPSGPSSSSSSSSMPNIQIKPVDDLEVVNLDAGPGASDIRINRDADSAPFVINTGSGFSGLSGDGSPGGDGSLVGGGEAGGMTPEQEATEKQKYLTKLRRLEANDIRGARMTMANSLAEIKAEHDKLTDSRNLEASIRFQRNALMTFVTGVEMVNDRFGDRLPVKPRLKGWSESVHTNVEDFDEIFEELYDMYKDQAKMHPMIRLVGTLGVSATMYHLTNTMAERTGIPGMADLLNENPELQRQFAAAAAAKMGGGLGNFMNAASGFGGPAPVGSPFQPPPPSPPRTGANTRVPFNVASSAFDDQPQQQAPHRARREMSGPKGVDDILKAFEAERANQAGPNIASVHAAVFTPSGPPPTPPRGINIMREGLGTPADPLNEFSIGGGDSGSVGTESTMNTERRRGRRRAVATPVGATLNLNV
jgi:Family of unknown function (DUF5767)